MKRLNLILCKYVPASFMLLYSAFGQAQKPNLSQSSGEAVAVEGVLSCFVQAWLIEPDTTARLRFYGLREYLAASEELVVEAVNAQVLQAGPEILKFRPSYSGGANNGYVLLIAREGDHERVLGVIRFASEEMPYDSPDDVQVHSDRAVSFPEIYDYESNQSMGFLGFFTDGPVADQVSIVVEYEQESAAPDRPRRLPKWVEAELKIPIGQVGSSIPPSALPPTPRDCRGFVNGRKTVEGSWINIGPAIPVGTPVNCGSISGSGNNTYTRTLCDKAAVDFATNLGVKVPGPGRTIEVGGSVKIRGEQNRCITVTVTNTTGATVSIICRTTRVNQLKFRDVYCCRNGQPHLCERWVCYRFVDTTVAEIPALGIVFPGVQSPSPETCTRVK